MPSQFNMIEEEPQKILVIKQRQLGDVLMGTAAIEALKKKFPNASIDFLTEKKCQPIVAHNPNIDNIFLIDRDKQSSFSKQVTFYRKVAKNNYDTVIALQTLPRVLMQVLFSEAKYKVGPYSKHYKNVLFTHLTKIEKDYPAIENIEILRPLGIEKPSLITGTFYLNATERAEAKNLLLDYGYDIENSDKKLIMVDLTHKDFRRAYPPLHYANLLNYINKNVSDSIFYFPCAPGEEDQVKAITQCLENQNSFIVPKKIPSLAVSAAIMSMADYHIGACSYPRHLAVSFDIPSTSLIGISHENWDYKSDRHLVVRTSLDCQPCVDHRKCSDPRCMKELYPELIQEKVVEHIKKYA